MKRLLIRSAGKLLLPPTGIFFALLLTIASCKKNETTSTTSTDDLTRFAAILQGEIISSPIQDAQDEDGLAFVCRDGKELLCLQKISSLVITTTGTVANATIIYSDYGILVRNNANQETWLYIQNTPESRKKFEQVRSELTGSISSTEIAGTIRIQLPNG